MTVALALLLAAAAPTGELSNGRISLSYYLPDAAAGYYRGTRFDWAGLVSRLEYRGQRFYGPWYDRIDPAVRDFTDTPDAITVGTNSSAMGPAEEFAAIGYDEAAPGATFLKIGVGLLRRADDKPYNQFRSYDVADAGQWSVAADRRHVSFTQTLRDRGSGYGYVYTKTLRLVAGKAELRVEHVLRNTGQRMIAADVYSHNFLVTGLNTGPDFAITAPYAITNAPPRSAALATVTGHRVGFTRPLTPGERVFMPVEGKGPYDFRVENLRTGAGFTVKGDRPIERVVLWSIRTTISLEPFIAIRAAPGQETRWSYRYRYFAPASRRRPRH
ncbi:hypothetical protein [Sphingomonas quercus]|uniref:DUF3108 domain-containing protein n=1 Tax=Sphingomonas quercus TaxID=2842451 RepID=A0ABS6BEN5_9SPHN|nr:hypothetical protein [Sphingomonas quercus]MBU3076624.1 hypothetical protein [Sphingomonas quercus]